MNKAYLALPLALLAGCSFIPAYERPAAPVPAQFAGASEAASALPAWQNYFTDPTLRALIDTALENNRDLRIALARVEEARGLAGIARSDRIPIVEVQAGANRNRGPSNTGTSNAARISSRYDVALGVTAFELDFWGRVAALEAAAKSQYLASEEAAKSFRVSLVGDVANTWFQLAELAEREQLANETLKSREESLNLLRKRQEAGLATDLDVLAAESLAESVRTQSAELTRQHAQTENALRLLTGTADSLPAASAVSQQTAMSELAPGLPSDVLLRRPDVRAAEQRLLAANANVGAARAAFFPRITLTAAFGTASAALSGLFGAGSQAWLFQPALRQAIFESGRAQSNLDVAEARKSVAVADYEKTIQQAFREVADALAARASYQQQLSAQEANLRAQEARLERVKARQEIGIANYLEVLDASRDAFSAKQALVSTRRQALASQIALYKALGGGE